MKRLIPLLFLITVPLFAFNAKKASLVDDVIRMSQAGISDETIVAYVQHMREPFEVSGDDVLAMTNAHVSKDVIKFVVDEARRRKEREQRQAVSADDVIPIYLYYFDPHWYMPRLYSAVGSSRPSQPPSRASGSERPARGRR